jgi:carbamoyl-phosphate synthase small subunit
LAARRRAVLALEDGSLFAGASYGATGRVEGEVVFNTAMTGYQEVLTDPSYHGQLVVMTASQIGNTGVNDEDPESGHPHVRGFLAREFSRTVSSWRATRSLDDYMREWGVVGIHEIDTRRLTRLIREKGCQRGVIASGDVLEEFRGDDGLREAARAVPDLATLDVVRQVTSPRRFEWRGDEPRGKHAGAEHVVLRTGPTIAVLDCGMKRNILRKLSAHGARVIVFPATAKAEEILDAHPDGLFVTNGPGDPRAAGYAVDTVRSLVGKLPIQGICLGHQLLALACGAETFKLKFGHHGANHPVRHEVSGRIEITSQNHNYAVDPESAQAVGFEITHRSLFDGTVEGMMHRDLALYCVQYHPEAAPGPHDSGYLWEEFLDHLGGKVR